MNTLLSPESLKKTLQAVRAANFEPADPEQPATLLDSMLAHLGNPDPELRDRLIYIGFVYWIEPEHKALFAPQQLRHILHILLDVEHLQLGLGEHDTDTVFTRAFSALTIAPILVFHRERPFLTAEELQHLKTQLITYLGTERDFRGYVEGKGWAHAVAHTADVLNELALCSEMGKDDLMDILLATQDAVANRTVVYTHQEEDRLMEVVDSIYSRTVLKDSDWDVWRVRFADLPGKNFPESYYASVNSKHFLQSLYIRADQNAWDATFNTALFEMIMPLFGD